MLDSCLPGGVEEYHGVVLFLIVVGDPEDTLFSLVHNILCSVQTYHLQVRLQDSILR